MQNMHIHLRAKIFQYWIRRTLLTTSFQRMQFSLYACLVFHVIEPTVFHAARSFHYDAHFYELVYAHIYRIYDL